MLAQPLTKGEAIEFGRRKYYEYVQSIGRGGCAQTILVRDPVIDEVFVCKKHAPFNDDGKEVLFPRFLREIKILHKLAHRNIVRVFNYYLYPSAHTGYIMMEYIDGLDIEEYLKSKPEDINALFQQAIEGFAYLESNNILHRDIRRANLLVTKEGLLKIIDFGFGKISEEETRYNKSISLNWWCDTPNDFNEEEYNHTTEVYFLGMQFKKIIDETQNSDFMFRGLLREMISKSPTKRISSFKLVKQKLLEGQFRKSLFNSQQKEAYKNIAEFISETLITIRDGTKYVEDVDVISDRLDLLCRNNALEDYLQANSSLLTCFINGGFKLTTRPTLQVSHLENFSDFFSSLSEGKKRIVLANLHGRLDAIDRQSNFSGMDDVPF